ncbi:MAG: heavy metal translocating P-type ATPase [Patescibacteria group bacterium]|nr:heavy metal translocating P-type ATPase [Patescibacteria group bacterium]
MKHENDSKKHCTCDKNCLCCQAEELTVSSGSDMEAKQYEYDMKHKIGHKEHEQKEMVMPKMDHTEHAPSTSLRAGGHDMSKMSHMDHEAAMTSPEMAKEMEADMKRRFWISLILSVPIFLYSPVGANILKISLPAPIPVNWILFILTTPIVFWAGSIFITGTYYSLKNKKLNMSVLITTGVLAAYLFSVFLTLTVGGETFYEAAALLVTFVLFGHWMEMRSRRGTSDALRALFDLVPPKANVIRDGKEISVPTAEIVAGDVVVLKPGDKAPVDGQIIEGESSIDESLVTGESIPAAKKTGDKIIGGSVNQTGSVRFKATGVGSNTVLAQIIKLVETAQNSKAPGQRIADKAAAWLVVLAIGSGLATFFGWYTFAGATLLTALTFAVSAVVIACPDALGLAIPTAVAVGTGIGAKHNILIKDASTLENTSRITAIALDKTGTLTEGKPKITDMIPVSGVKSLDLLKFTASVEAKSGHPLSLAILEEAKKKHISYSEKVEKFNSLAGLGIEATVEGKHILVGTMKLMAERKIDISPLKDDIDRLLQEGKTLMLVSIDGKLAGVAAAADVVRSNAKKTISELTKLGIEVWMITGDNERTAKAIAKEVGIDNVLAEILPDQKALVVKALQLNELENLKLGRWDLIRNLKFEISNSRQRRVAMVGDGINDAPALARADIGIAIGAGTDVAIETGNIVLMKSDPYDIVRAIKLSRATVGKMKQNLFWASIYNILAIPVAAGLFYTSFGILLRPEISALLMSASSIIVATNAVMLKRVETKLVG